MYCYTYINHVDTIVRIHFTRRLIVLIIYIYISLIYIYYNTLKIFEMAINDHINE